jgi:hypothetical protein
MSAATFYGLNLWRTPEGLTLREASELFMGRSHTAISYDCDFLGIKPNDGSVAFITEDRALLLYAFYCWRHYNTYSHKAKYWVDCTPCEVINAGIQPSKETASIKMREGVMIRVAGLGAEKRFRRMYSDLFTKTMRAKIQRGVFAVGA